MSAAPITIQQQADAVECCFLEWRNSTERLESLPIGKGGMDPAAIRLKWDRVRALEAAAHTLQGLAATGAERGAA